MSENLKIFMSSFKTVYAILYFVMVVSGLVLLGDITGIAEYYFDFHDGITMYVVLLYLWSTVLIIVLLILDQLSEKLDFDKPLW